MGPRGGRPEPLLHRCLSDRVCQLEMPDTATVCACLVIVSSDGPSTLPIATALLTLMPLLLRTGRSRRQTCPPRRSTLTGEPLNASIAPPLEKGRRFVASDLARGHVGRALLVQTSSRVDRRGNEALIGASIERAIRVVAELTEPRRRQGRGGRRRRSTPIEASEPGWPRR